MSNKKMSVLIIDDDEVALKLLSVMLRGKGFKVLTAKDPAQGLESAFNEHPDLIILDVFMPVMDGWGVLRELRARESSEKIPIIMLSSADKLSDAEQAFRLGANAYLTKPLDPIVFNKKVMGFIKKQELAESKLSDKGGRSCV